MGKCRKILLLREYFLSQNDNNNVTYHTKYAARGRVILWLQSNIDSFAVSLSLFLNRGKKLQKYNNISDAPLRNVRQSNDFRQQSYFGGC